MEAEEPNSKDTIRVRTLLDRARGESDRAAALHELLPIVREELHRIASAQMRSERPGHTLQPTALVNEAFLRLTGDDQLDWKDKAHFLMLAATTMRRILVEHARARQAEKRGGDRPRVTLTDGLGGATAAGDPVDLLDLEEQLEALRELYDRPARVVELRFFGGLSFEESGHVLGISPRTAQADWYFARAWLQKALRDRD